MDIIVSTSAYETMRSVFGLNPDAIGQLIKLSGDDCVVFLAAGSSALALFASDGINVNDSRALAAAYQATADTYDAVTDKFAADKALEKLLLRR